MPRTGKAAELARWLAGSQPDRIGEAEFAQVRAALAPISESYLRKLLRQCGTPLDILVAGVSQSGFPELEDSLRQLSDAYERGAPALRQTARRLVITAKEHARLAARIPAKRSEKQEMILWLTTWLENPPLFPDWVRVRREALKQTEARKQTEENAQD
jgi:hypothetical protein